MKRKDDLKRANALAERDRTEMRVAVLSHGIAHELTETRCGNYEHLRGVLKQINAELVPALEAAEAAEKAYEPYWRRRTRTRTYNAAHRKPKAAATKAAVPPKPEAAPEAVSVQ